MKRILGKLFTETLFLVMAYCYYFLVLVGDIVLTKTDDALLDLEFMKIAAPFLFMTVWFFALKEIIMHPFLNCFKYKINLSTWTNLDKAHDLRKSFNLSHFKQGWFGVLQMNRMQGYICIHRNAGTKWEANKYPINPLLEFYLIRFRQYSLDGNEEYLTKPLK